MDAREIIEHIQVACEGLDIYSTEDAYFLYYDPERDLPHDHRQPFATILLTDAGAHPSDRASGLARRGAIRLNLGVERETYRAFFGPEPPWGEGGGVVATGHDFTHLDTVLPHPIYAPMSWICIVAPSRESWPHLCLLIDEAHARARRQHERRSGTPKP